MKKFMCFSVMVIMCLAAAQVSLSSPGPLGEMPLYFLSNQGQVDRSVRYYARTSDYTLWLTPGALIFDTTSREKVTDKSNGLSRVSRDVSWLEFVGADRQTLVEAAAPTDYKVNILKGDQASWKTGLETYRAVIYRNIYDKIDLKVYGTEGRIEYDWTVKAGSDPDRIRIAYRNVKSTGLDDSGSLVLETGVGKLVHRKPVAYQTIGGRTVPVDVEFEKIGPDIYKYRVAGYDRDHDLVIDPLILGYSTYLGGGTNPGLYDWPDDSPNSIAVDANGCAYVVGSTASTDFPTLNAYDSTLSYSWNEDDGNVYESDVFVTKFSAAGNSLVYSTYVGGNGSDTAYGVAVDSSGCAYVTGSTDYGTASGSGDYFPTTGAAYDSSYNGSGDTFILKLSANGSSLLYSTFLGGTNGDVGMDLALDSSNNVYVTGYTSSVDFPTSTYAYQTTPGSWEDSGDGWNYNDDVFVAKLNSTLSSLLYSTYLGGGNSETTGTWNDRGWSIGVGANRYAYISGYTTSTTFPTKNAYDGTKNSNYSAFVAKLDPSATSSSASLVYSTFLEDSTNASSNSFCHGLAVDSYGHAFVSGKTNGANFPTTNGAFQTTYAGNGDFFVTEMSLTGATLVYSTFLGGTGQDTNRGLALDSSGCVYVTGYGSSTDFPTKNAYSASSSGTDDVYVAKLSAAGDSLEYSTYLGGAAQDMAANIAVDGSGNAYVTGRTISTDFPTAQAYDTSYAGNGDAFVTKLTLQGGVNPALPLLLLD